MTNQSMDLFSKRSTTREFLFTRSDDLVQAADGDAADDPCGIANGWSTDRFGDMLDRETLVATIASTFADVARLCVVAVRLVPSESPPSHSPSEPPTADELADIVDPVVTLCRDQGGIWARLGRCRFAFVFAHLDESGGRLLADRMQQALAGDASVRLTVGIAAYPTANDTRSETVANAEKALVHAGFFGPGSITGFDAVSLNISGDQCYQKGDIQGAINDFQRGLRLSPSDTNLLNSLGVCYGVLGDYDKALAAFEMVIWLAPQELMAVYNKGYVLLCQGQPGQALECFLAAEALEPGVFEVVFHIGQLLMEVGQAQQARPYLEAATRANHRSGPAYRHLGACLNQLGLTKEAIQAYKTVVKINPQDAASLSSLGKLYTERGESLDVAGVLCEQSVQIEPDNGLFRYRLGHVYLQQGRLDTALAEFEVASALGHACRSEIEATQDRMMAAKAS